MAVTKTNKPAKTPFTQKVAKFFREYKSEMKKISWSSGKQTMNNTWVVLVCAIAVAVVVGLVDFGVSKGLVALGSLIG